MGLSAFRSALRFDRTLWRTLLLTFAVVATIVIGLLAMHTLNLGHGESVSVNSSTAQSSHSMTMPSGDDAAGGGDGCGSVPCSPEHSMTAMACILALLVLGLLIGMIRMVVAWGPMRDNIAALPQQWGSLPAVAPPSLLTLCISRT